jgi:hypothetical protein
MNISKNIETKILTSVSKSVEKLSWDPICSLVSKLVCRSVQMHVGRSLGNLTKSFTFCIIRDEDFKI